MPDSKEWRTDRAEYTYPITPEDEGLRGDAAVAEAGLYDEEPYGEGSLGGDDGARPAADSRSGGRGRWPVGSGRQSGAPTSDSPARASGWPADEGAGHGGGAAAQGSDRPGGEDHPRGGAGSRGRRGRGRRGRDSTEPSDGPQDGGFPFSSKAGKGEAPGDPAEQARAICLRLLTGTPRTRKQLADALRKREIPEDVADEVLSRFEEVGLINDSAFADAWVESRHHGRGLARRALARELRTKGVDSALIDDAVSQLDSEQEEATARELVARKLRATRGLDRDKRLRRLAGMLARKGYPEGMALRVVRQALEEEGEDTEGMGDDGF